MNIMSSELSVIIPCRNEAKFIATCLDSLLLQDYPKEKLEILVVDGMSQDTTREILKEYAKYSFIKVLDNPKKITPAALNIGIKNAKGSIIMRMDAHATYEKNYMSECVRYLKEYNADNVGGIIKTVPSKDTLEAKSIALCLGSRFGVGSSFFRAGSPSVMEVDTVFGGCYKREVFDKIGLFNENLARSQDMEFNMRLKKAGGKILLIPNIVSYYHPKSTLIGFLKHNFLDGKWAIIPMKFIKRPLKLRHYIPLMFVLSLLALGILGFFFPLFFFMLLSLLFFYFLLMGWFSFKTVLREKDMRYLFTMPVAFAVRHFGYGLGELAGIFDLFINKKLDYTKPHG